MNERIKELAEQARIKDHWSIDEARYLTNYLDEQKFAELLIQECMSICEDTKVSYFKHRKAAYDFQDKNIYAEGEAAADMIKYKIKRHFELDL